MTSVKNVSSCRGVRRSTSWGRVVGTHRRVKSAAPGTFWTLCSGLGLGWTGANFARRHGATGRTVELAGVHVALLGDRRWGRSLATTSRPDALPNPVAASSCLAPAQMVDVGCGIGGSSRYIGRKFGCTSRGITLSPKQVRSHTHHTRRQPCHNT